MNTYKIILIVCMAVFAFGLSFGLNINFKTIFNFFRKKNKKETNLKEKIEVLSGHAKENFFKKQLTQAEKMLTQTGNAGKYKTIKIAIYFLGIIGAIIAVLMKNYFLIPVFVFGLSSIPLLYIKVVASKYSKQLNNDLESGLHMITSSYMKKNSIIGAIKENINELPETIKNVFQEFCFELENVDPNLVTSLNNMKFKINHPLFHEWIDTLIQCDKDNKMKSILNSVLEKFSALRVAQSKMETALAAPKLEALIMLPVVVGQLPFLRMINKDWYEILFTTIQGRIGLAIGFGIVVYCMIKIVTLSKPIEYYGKEK